MKKKVTLHKANEMVRGGDSLSIHAKRLLNSIYYIIQFNVNKGKKDLILQTTYIPIEFPYLRKMMGLEKVESYIREIEDAFKELQNPIQLHNFKDPRDGTIYNWYSISIVSEASWKIDSNKKIAYVALSPLAKWLMVNTNDGGNFTKLNLIPTINKLRTKYSIKLYEFLKSFAGYRYLDIHQKHLLKLFGLDGSKTYKYYSDLERLLERQIKELVEKTDLKQLKLKKTSKLKKDKVFRIEIDPKSKKKKVDEKSQEAVLNSIVSKF
jgi:phosphoribosylformylglycinamidine (FGAM) synthase PurS component